MHLSFEEFYLKSSKNIVSTRRDDGTCSGNSVHTLYLTPIHFSVCVYEADSIEVTDKGGATDATPLF